jgi:hypothetical protein
MFRAVPVAGWLIAVVSLYADGAADQKPFVECNRDELVRAIPDLANIRFGPYQAGLDDQAGLDWILNDAGRYLEGMLPKAVDISAAEDIHEMRFAWGVDGTSRREAFRYIVKTSSAGTGDLVELRVDAHTGAPVQPPASSDFLVFSRFLQFLDYLFPVYRAESTFRYEGRLSSGGDEYFVLAFGSVPRAKRCTVLSQSGSTAKPPLCRESHGSMRRRSGWGEFAWIYCGPSSIIRWQP